VTFSLPPPPIVPDASVLVDALLAEPVASEAWRRWADEERMLLAPPLVWVEVANVLLRRYRMPASVIAAKLELLVASGLETADRGPRGVAAAVGLAGHHGLTAYDATCLWLAIDVDGELATTDVALIRAAEAEGVALAIPPAA
jgi:predicted nucleic acid-binding protein